MDECKFEKAELDALERVLGDANAEPIDVTFSLLKHITNDFSDRGLVGRGGSAGVYRATLPNGSHIAVKMFFEMHTIQDSAFRDEVEMTIKAAHKNTVRLIGYCCHTDERRVQFDGKHVWAEARKRLICMEYVPNGSLDRHISGFHYGLEWYHRYQILKGICQALSYLHHEVRVIHRDIKPANVLLGDNFEPKLVDFGFSTCLDEGEDFVVDENIGGTPGYLAPESFGTGHLSFKSDIYSLGVIILELTGSKSCDSVEQALESLGEGLVKDEAFSSREKKYQQVRTCLEIGFNCIEFDADKRPTALEIIQLLDKTEITNYSVSSGHAPPLWQSGDEELDLSDTDTIEQETEPESPAEFPPSDQEPADINMDGETSTQEDDKSDLVSELPTSADLSDLKFLEKITDGFSLEKLVGIDGAKSKGFPTALIYEGTISDGTMITVKRLIVVTHVKKFEREAELLMSLNHKNIVKLLGYCHDESRVPKLVLFKGKEIRDDMGKNPEQLLSYEYMHNGSLHAYLTGTQEFDWPTRYDIIKGTCEGLYYLHESHGGYPIVHLNLTPANVLLDKDYIPHITGLDITRLIGENRTNSLLEPLNGPIRYLPGDFLNETVPNQDLSKVDIYSLGLVILEIATRQEIGDKKKFINSVNNWSKEPQIASLYTSLEPHKLCQVKLCIEIGNVCVNPEPKYRPTAGAIIHWLKTGKGPERVPESRPVARRPPVAPQVHTNVTQADDRTQGKEKPTGIKKIIPWMYRNK